jgi:hypothetical protein
LVSWKELGMRFLYRRGRGVGVRRLIVDDGGSLAGTDGARALAEPFGGLGEHALPVGKTPLSYRLLVFVPYTS